MLRITPLRIFGFALLLWYGAVGLYFIFHVPFSDYAPDWHGHMTYIGNMMKQWRVPGLHDNWQAYQPPLYYVVSACMGAFAMAKGILPFMPLRLYSFFLIMVFAAYGMLFIRLALRSTALRVICCLLFISWPLMLCLPGRISNEVMLYPFWAACYYYLLRWQQQQRGRDLVTALGLCAFMMLVKTSALVPLASVGAVMLYELLAKRARLCDYFRKEIIIVSMCILLTAGLNFMRPVYYNMHHAFPVNLIIGNLTMDPLFFEIHTDNSLKHFSTVNTDNLMSEPFWNFRNEASGRQFFWNSYLKSMMFGFFEWPPIFWAFCLDVFLVALCIYAVLGSLMVRSSTMRVTQLCVVVAVAAQLIDRIMIQTVTTQDGRLTFPVIIPFLALLCQITEQLGKRKWLYCVPGMILLCCFLLCAEYFTFEFLYGLKPVPPMPHIAAHS